MGADNAEQDRQPGRTGEESQPKPVARRRPKGLGSLSKRRDGLWHGRIEIRSRNGKRKRQDFYSRDRDEVIRQMSEARVADLQGLPIPDRTMKVSKLFDLYFERAPLRDLAPNTVKGNQGLARFMKPRIGGFKVRELLPSDVTQLLYDMDDEGYSTSYAGHMRAFLGQVLNWAEGEGIVNRNVARLASPVRYRRLDREADELTIDEAIAFLDAAERHPFGALVIIMMLLGLRPGEAAGLTWDDVDFEAEVVRVRRSLKKWPNSETGKEELVLGGLKKSRHDRRNLKMPQRAKKVLEAPRVW